MDEYIRELCRRAGEEETFASEFQKALCADEEVYREFVYYAEHNDFACEVKVEGYSVVDILIWQIDHFRAWLDRDTTGTKRNGDRMVLLAFDTMLKMRKDPQKYLEKMLGETGTDRPI
jgi:hypothetical protein